MDTDLDTAADIDCIIPIDKDETTILFNKSIMVKQTVSICGNRLV